MSASASYDEEVRPDQSAQDGDGDRRLLWVEAMLAAAAFATMCVMVLSVAPQSAEPDDGAYHASIVGITQGHFLTLTAVQARALARELDDNPAEPPSQWIQLTNGRYISEKDPGYPFLAAPFEKLGIIRWAPLFYGALACLSIFVGARRWLGRFGGLTAVGLFCTSGAALAFAWRDYMPTFTDASLIAAGSGALVWTMLATDVTPQQRGWVGFAGFTAIEMATFVRYTNIVILGCAVVAAVAAWRLRAARLPTRALCWWLGSVAVFGVGVAIFDQFAYGGPLTTGYRPGEVTFGLSVIGTNLRILPAHLMQAMPMLASGLLSLAWIVGRWVRLRRVGGRRGALARRDLHVGLALAASWFAIWGLYSAYAWTTDPTNVTVQVVRFYLPAIGAISLLGAWLITRVPGRAWLAGLTSTAVLTTLFVQGVAAFHAMYVAFGIALTAR